MIKKKIKNTIERYSNNRFVQLLVQLVMRFNHHTITAYGAQLSYYLLISVFPFIIFFLNLLSYTPLANVDFLSNLLKFLPLDIQIIILNLVHETVQSSNQALLSLGVITGLWAASKGALAFIRAMNKAYGVKEKRGYIRVRFLSILFTILLFLSLFLVLATLVFGELLGNKLFSRFGFAHAFVRFWTHFRKLISLFSIIVIFAFLYKFAPCKKRSTRINILSTLPGSIFSSIGWIITSLIFSYYINNFGNYSKTYGSLGGVIVLLLWLYLSSIIFILGGEINAVLETMRLSK